MKYFLIFFISLVIASCNFAPGSYPHAEKYEIDSDESDLIKAIEIFKKKNPEYAVPKQISLKDGRTNDKDHWYHIYFYLPKENQIIYGWTRPSENGKTILAFVSVNNGLTLGNWRDINKDFSNAENEDERQIFEQIILLNIKKYLSKNPVQ